MLTCSSGTDSRSAENPLVRHLLSPLLTCQADITSNLALYHGENATENPLEDSETSQVKVEIPEGAISFSTDSFHQTAEDSTSYCTVLAVLRRLYRVSAPA
jgi:hypothetical protein